MTDLAVDIAVIGAGIAGASAAYELASGATVALIEREPQPGYHSSGRSAALYTETYGQAPIRALAMGSREFLERPPTEFSTTAFLAPRGVLWIGREDQAALIRETHAEARRLASGIELLDGAQARELCPVLHTKYVSQAVWERGAMDIDVHALHQCYLRGFKRRSGQLLTNSGITRIEADGSGWRLHAGEAGIAARVVVNAAGAWADEVAAMAGVPPIGLQPMRRTAFTFDAPPGSRSADWPCVLDAAEEFYFKPEAGRLLGSPADETPVPPCDAQPDDLDVAIAVDRIERAAELEIRRVHGRWAGLRSFVADRCPVIGCEPDHPSYYWLAGQGGYGIMISPAAARATAQLVLNDRLPEDLESLGLSRPLLAPERSRA